MNRPRPERTLRLLTTQGNLTRYLTAGQLFPLGGQAPAWTNGKWASDPAQRTPELLPLFAQPPGDRVIHRLLDLGRHQVPVLIDLRADGLHAFTATVDGDYLVQPGERVGDGDTIVAFVNGMLPTSYIRKIYFPSEPSREVFISRSTGNFDPAQIEHLLEAAPGAFAGNLDPDRLEAALDEASATTTPPVIPVAAADRLSGALMLATRLIEGRNDLNPARLNAGLNAVWHASDAQVPSPAGDDILPLVAGALLPAASGSTTAPSQRTAPTVAALALLRDEPELVYQPDRLLTTLAERISLADDRWPRLIAMAEARPGAEPLPDDAPAAWLSLVDLCRAAVHQHFVVPVADDPERALFSSLLIGALAGRSSLTSDELPTEGALTSRIDGLVALRANAVAGGPDPLSHSVTAFTVGRTEAEAGGEIWLETSQGRQLLQRPDIFPDDSVIPFDFEHALRTLPLHLDEFASEALVLATMLNWLDLGTTTIAVAEANLLPGAEGQVQLRILSLLAPAAIQRSLKTEIFRSRLGENWPRIVARARDLAPLIVAHLTPEGPLPPTFPVIEAHVDQIKTSRRRTPTKDDEAILAAELSRIVSDQLAIPMSDIVSFFAKRSAISEATLTKAINTLGYEYVNSAWRRIAVSKLR